MDEMIVIIIKTEIQRQKLTLGKHILNYVITNKKGQAS